MIMRINWGRIQAGKWPEYEAAFRRVAVESNKGTKGLRGRWLVKDTQENDTGFSLSLWDGLADVEAYEESSARREIVAALQPFYLDDFKAYLCQVMIDEEFPQESSPQGPRGST